MSCPNCQKAELAAALAERALGDEQQGRALDTEAARRRLDEAAQALGREMAKVASLERKLAIAKAAIPEMVACSGCGLEVTTRSMAMGQSNRFHIDGPSVCGEWMKDGKPWDCEHPEDVVDVKTEVGDD